MSETLFRGKRANDDIWVEGSLLIDGDKHRPSNKPHMAFSNMYIIPETELDITHCMLGYSTYLLHTVGFHVDSATIGQYSGLVDNTKWDQLTEEEQSNWLRIHTADEWCGKKIFEGDVMEFEAYGNLYKGVVTIEGGNTSVFCEGGSPFLDDAIKRHGAVKIGNIYDNPELLGGADNA